MSQVIYEEPVPLPPHSWRADFEAMCLELDVMEVRETRLVQRGLNSMRGAIQRYRRNRYRKDATWRKRFTVRETSQPGWVRVWRIR
jgi:hypothetical protein